jgi:hypothetical protein
MVPSYVPTRDANIIIVDDGTRRRYDVPSTIVLRYRAGMSGLGMDDDALGIWIAVTEDRILLNSLIVLGDDGSGLEASVNSVVRRRGEGAGSDFRRWRRLPREVGSGTARSIETRAIDNEDLEEPPPSLEIAFVANIAFSSERDDWDPNEMVSGGFRTSSDREEYVRALSGEDPAFEGVERMSMEVDGMTVPEEDGTNDGTTSGGEVGSGNGDKSLFYILGGVLGGALTFLTFGIMFYRAGRQSRDKDGLNEVREEGRSSTASPASPEETPSGPAVVDPQPPSRSPSWRRRDPRKYGDMMIESPGADDDISTLGDPYLGEGGGKAIYSTNDEMIAEQSLISAGDEIYVYGTRRRLNTKDGGSTMFTEGGGSKMVFGDDTTLEGAYLNNPFEVGGSARKDYQHFVVDAPAGALGIVIDNVTGDLPIVHAIRETSVLQGMLSVGDFLVSVDEVDCRGMSAMQVSKLISGRSENPNRRLALLRVSSN